MNQQKEVQSLHGWQVTDMTIREDETCYSQQSVSLLPQNGSQQEQINADQFLSDVSTISEHMTPDISNVSNNNAFQDRFENIFYTVADNKDKNKLCILFATKELFSSFLSNFQKGFQSQESENGVKTFKFHVQKQKCTVTSHDEDSGITVKGQGYKLWRQTGFIKLATKLYHQYVMETNESLGINEQPTSLPLPAHASTPCINRHMDGTSLISTQSIHSTGSPLAEIMKSQAEMKSQTASLMEMVINLQEQIQQINATHREHVHVQQYDAGGTEDPYSSTTEDMVHMDIAGENTRRATVTVPGAMPYNEAVKSTPVTENVAPQQSQLGTNHNKEAQRSQNEQSNRQNAGSRNVIGTNSTTGNTQTNQSQNKNKTLLIGDSLLSAVNRKGLKNNVHCAPFPGATIDIINKNISMYNLTQFKNVIIYCGGNDSATPDKMEHFKKGYETLLKFIKTKNAECMVYMCNSCPRGHTDTTRVNNEIKSLAEAHGASYVDANSAFYDYNNELRTKFYKPRDWIHLSNSGTKRLLGTINSLLPIVENFKFCVYQQVSENKPEISNSYKHGKPRYHGQHRREQQNQREPDTTLHNGRSQRVMQHNRDTISSYGGQRRSADPYPDNDNNHYQYRSTSQDTYQHEYYGRNENYGHNYARNENYGQYYDQNSHQQVERCMKCGLTNHTTIDCHHKGQLLCYACNNYGHKDSICWNK